MNTRKKILWLSPHVPYDKVQHAGGKNHNYYVKFFQRTGKYDIHLLSQCMRADIDRIDLKEAGIAFSAVILDAHPMKNKVRQVIDKITYYQPLDRYAGACETCERKYMREMIRSYAESGEVPDIIIAQWTFSIFFLKELKTLYPAAICVAIEEDVTFLNYQRRIGSATSLVGKWFWSTRTHVMKQEELKILRDADITVVNNPKDEKLLLETGYPKEKLFTSTLYFDHYQSCRDRRIRMNRILFWGAMSRPENYNTAIWLIDRVLPLLPDEIELIVAGANPPSVLKKRDSERIHITGFVEDPQKLFDESICLAAPLTGGAGMKVKVLEALSAGLPILTNEIGAEGIGMKPGRDYLHCETPEEYVASIRRIMEDRQFAKTIGENGRQFVLEHFDLDRKLNDLITRIENCQHT